MALQYLRDRRGVVIGSLDEDSTRITLRDKRGVIKGNYNKLDNRTRDVRGVVVGTGNLLMTLLDF